MSQSLSQSHQAQKVMQNSEVSLCHQCSSVSLGLDQHRLHVVKNDQPDLLRLNSASKQASVFFKKERGVSASSNKPILSCIVKLRG